jgi:hypothetical protein
MATLDRELLEKVFSVFAKKNNNSNLGWGTVGVALMQAKHKFANESKG